uniref:Mitochondrial potassium channel ATP-binding subunit n=1 Tax=Amphiprion ocellaris TaxID=80972 RepID=A0AAQ5Y3R0_AMPOC
ILIPLCKTVIIKFILSLIVLLFWFISRWYTSPGSNAYSSLQRPGNAVSRIWSQTQRAVRQSTTRTSKHPGVALKFILGPAALTVSARLFCHVAHCEADVNNNTPVEVVAKQTVPEFKWHILWEFLKPQLFALIGAVVVSLNQFISRQYPNTMKVFIDFEYSNPLDAWGSGQCCGTLLERTHWELLYASFSPLIPLSFAFFVYFQGLRSITQTVGCFVSLYVISPKLTGLTVVVLPCLVGAGALIGSFLRKLSRLAQEQVAKATGVADEALGNVRTVKAFAMEERELQLYAYEVDKSCDMNENLGAGIAVFQGLSNMALNCIVLGTIFAGGTLISSNEMSPGDLMSFLVASQTVQRSLASISILFGQMVRGLSSGARVFEYLALQPTIPLCGGGRIPYHSLTGRVDFMNISFSYPTRPGHQVLQKFSLTLPPSKTVAIVGESGGGKSTVASLLERFYDPTSGVIMLDGLDIRTLDLSWLRGQVIGFINQEPVLFGSSIMENIRFGKPEATDAEVINAAKQANAHRFITGFPDGYNTVVGERGVTLSGGQKQRIAIARALIKNPSILVLDEATSALDAESERVVQEALDRATRGRTVLIIAHRLSTIQGADLICVISNGRIVEVRNPHSQRNGGALISV